MIDSLPLATTMYMPLWGAITIGVVVMLMITLLTFRVVQLAEISRNEKAISSRWMERCHAMHHDQETIRKVVSEEVADHNGRDELVNIMRTAYENHYGKFREKMVNGFTDRSSEMIGNLADDLTSRLMASVQPIFNDVGGEENFILPTGIKYAYQRGRSIVVLVENPAGLRSTTFTEGSLNGNKEKRVGKLATNISNGYARKCYRFNLSFPYTYFLFTFDVSSSIEKPSYQKFDIFFRNTPLTSIKQNLYPAPLLNMGNESDGNGYVCMGQKSVNTRYKSISQMCDELIAEWWSRAFHNDLNEGDFRSSPLGNIKKWSEKSATDPYWACKCKWKNGIKTKRVLEEANRYGGAATPIDCKVQVEAATYEIAKQINHTVNQLKPETHLTEDDFEPASVKAFQNSLVLLTNKIINRITD